MNTETLHHPPEPTVPAPLWRGRPAPARPDGGTISQATEIQHPWNDVQLVTRPVQKLPEAPKIDVLADISAELKKLKAAGQTFENGYGKPNQPLIDAKIEVETLRKELAEAEGRLKELEAKGDSIAHLRAAIMTSESLFLGLHGAAVSEVVNSLVEGRVGSGVPAARVPAHVREECKLHARVRGLDSHRLSHSFGPKGVVSKDDLLKALDRLGERFVALRDYVIADRQQNATA